MNLTTEQDSILKTAIKQFGADNQMDMVIEECSELIKAILKYRRANTIENAEEVLKETADVKIMLRQVEFIFGALRFDIDGEVNRKINRLRTKLKEK